MIGKGFKSILGFIASFGGAIKSAFDIRDVFIFGGLGMLGYGLYLFRPWVGFAIIGAILFYTGLFPWWMIKRK